MNAQIWFFRRLWERGRKRQKSGTHEAVAPLKRERTEDPQRTVKTRWSRDRRRPRRDAGRVGTGGGQQTTAVHSVLPRAKASAQAQPPHLRLLWFRPADWEGPRNAVPTMLWGVPPPPSLPPPLPLVEEDGGRRSGGSGHPAL